MFDPTRPLGPFEKHLKNSQYLGKRDMLISPTMAKNMQKARPHQVTGAIFP